MKKTIGPSEHMSSKWSYEGRVIYSALMHNYMCMCACFCGVNRHLQHKYTYSMAAALVTMEAGVSKKKGQPLNMGKSDTRDIIR